MPIETEQLRRAVARAPRIETREDGSQAIIGYAAVFYRADDPGTEFELWPGVVERIMPGAFDEVLAAKPDVRGLVNHDPNQLLGRTAAGTLELVVDKIGLAYQIEPPDTASARDALELLKRGDMNGSSFAFTVARETWTFIEDEDSELDEIREINEIGQLFDVGPVTYPAYTATEAGVRAEARASRDQWKERRRKEADAEKERLRGNRWKHARARLKALEASRKV